MALGVDRLVMLALGAENWLKSSPLALTGHNSEKLLNNREEWRDKRHSVAYVFIFPLRPQFKTGYLISSRYQFCIGFTLPAQCWAVQFSGRVLYTREMKDGFMPHTIKKMSLIGLI